jgi:hypothetical protein
MSRRDDRQRAQDAIERDRQEHERPGEPAPPPADPNPKSWGSWCPGWKYGTHARGGGVSIKDGIVQWRCRWCWQFFDPPAGKGTP